MALQPKGGGMVQMDVLREGGPVPVTACAAAAVSGGGGGVAVEPFIDARVAKGADIEAAGQPIAAEAEVDVLLHA